MSLIDPTAPVRTGEELDLDAVKAYLAKAVPELSGEIKVEQFPSGHSNLTYMLQIGECEVVLRRPPFGSKVKTAHDMGREYKILSAIHPVYSPAPEPLCFCEDESVIGARFYVMERIKGIIIRKEPPEGMDFSAETANKAGRSLIKNLAEIHAIDYRACGLGDFGKPEGFLERQVKGWIDRYHGSKLEEIEGVDKMASWLIDNIPESPPPTLIHNDYKYDNVVLDPDDTSKIIGVLDWEMSTIGDPLMDLGVALGYWIQADARPEILEQAMGPTHYPGSPTRQELAEYYVELTGVGDLGNMSFYGCMAGFRMAVVVQQIYYRFAKGHTADERFAPLFEMVKLIFEEAEDAMNSDIFNPSKVSGPS